MGFHPEITPASLEKMNTAGALEAPLVTTKPPPLLLNTRPVGAPSGMATTSDWIAPVVTLNRIDESLPLLAIHHGDVALAARPHAFSSRPSRCSAGISVVSSEIRFRCL